jgi:hypothetical protein
LGIGFEQTRHAKFMEEFLTSRELNAKRPQTTNRSTYKISYEQEYPEGNNTRYAWPRNTSQVAAESFDAELDDNGQPVSTACTVQRGCGDAKRVSSENHACGGRLATKTTARTPTPRW